MNDTATRVEEVASDLAATVEAGETPTTARVDELREIAEAMVREITGCRMLLVPIDLYAALDARGLIDADAIGGPRLRSSSST